MPNVEGSRKAAGARCAPVSVDSDMVEAECRVRGFGREGQVTGWVVWVVWVVCVLAVASAGPMGSDRACSMVAAAACLTIRWAQCDAAE